MRFADHRIAGLSAYSAACRRWAEPDQGLRGASRRDSCREPKTHGFRIDSNVYEELASRRSSTGRNDDGAWRFLAATGSGSSDGASAENISAAFRLEVAAGKTYRECLKLPEGYGRVGD